MAIPGTPGVVYTADGLTHSEAGIPSSQARDHRLQLDKRLRKLVGRLATYLQGYGATLVRANRWDLADLERFRQDPLVQGYPGAFDAIGTVAELSDATRDRLDAMLPAGWSRSNPVDLVTDIDADRYAGTIEALLDDPANDALLAVNVPTVLSSAVETAEAMTAVLRKRANSPRHKPVFAVWLGHDPAAADVLDEARIPNYPTESDAVNGVDETNPLKALCELEAEMIGLAEGGLAPINVLGDLVSMGTLLAFTTVCIGVLVLRRTRPDLPRAFRVPAAPVVCVLGALSCFALFAVAFKDNWLWMSGWIVAGLLVYFLYGYKRSKLRAQKR